jgi:hypothetical protein
LKAHGLSVVTVEVDELAKAEGGVTCCCLILDERGSSKDEVEAGLP